MIKFLHKKHLSANAHTGKIVIYYSAFDIISGIMLVALVAFFIHFYLVHSLVG
jgi:hypothetical protein